MAQQENEVVELVNDGYVVDTEDCAERELAHRERGTARPITVVGNPVLHHECKDVTEFGDELAQLIDDMFASQKAAEGVGLAANQIGVDAKVFVYDCPDDDGARHTGVVVNPKPWSCRPAPACSTTRTRAACRSRPRTPRWPARTTPR